LTWDVQHTKQKWLTLDNKLTGIQLLHEKYFETRKAKIKARCIT